MSEPSPTPSAAPPEPFLRQMRAALAGAEFDYTKGSLTRAVWLLAIPMVLEMLMESTFAVADVYFVSKLGASAVAAVGLTEAMLTIVYAFGIGFAVAATALVARRIGEKNAAGAVRAATSALALGLGFGVLIGAPCAVFAEELLALMDASAEVISTGAGYTRWVLGANVVVLMIHLGNGVLRGAGDAVLAMKTLAIANGINIVLDPLLIFGIGEAFGGLGLTGAGVATVIGRGAGVGYQCWALRRGVGRLKLRGPAFRVEPPILIEMLRLSAGTVGQFLIATSSWVVLMKVVSQFGETAVAGYTIAIRIVVFAFMPAWGLSNAAATLVGQNLGAKQPERAEKSVWLTGLYTMGFLAIVTAIFLSLAPELIAIFQPDEATALVGVEALRTLSYGYVFYAWGMATVQGFNGAGDTRTPTWMHFVCFWLIEIPLAWTLAVPFDLGPPGVFWSVCISESILAVVGVLLFRRGSWKHAQVAPDTVPAA